MGPSAEAAVKAAVMVEDVAHTVWIALQMGQPDEITPENVAQRASPLYSRVRTVSIILSKEFFTLRSPSDPFTRSAAVPACQMVALLAEHLLAVVGRVLPAASEIPLY